VFYRDGGLTRLWDACLAKLPRTAPDLFTAAP
jgi:hypothetical protein